MTNQGGQGISRSVAGSSWDFLRFLWHLVGEEETILLLLLVEICFRGLLVGSERVANFALLLGWFAVYQLFHIRRHLRQMACAANAPTAHKNSEPIPPTISNN